MTIDDVIARLQELREAHGGDVVVFHHDDWDDFVVDEIAYDDGRPVSADDPWHNPRRAVLRGSRLRSDGAGGVVAG
jgi:hypothetical protein